MNINKNNYEEWFLLFADNELSADQKYLVENFVKQHPELEDDFLSITQSILYPEENLKLDDKSFLFNQTKKYINHNNYQQVFIQYNDNELSNDERSEAEVFLSENPSIRSGVELLQKVKLEPDESIVFPDKKSLFKKEDTGKVIPFKWWKAAAAAILLGFAILAGITFKAKNKTGIPVAVKDKIAPKQSNINSPSNDTSGISQPQIVAEKTEVKNFIKPKSSLQSIINKPQVLKEVKEEKFKNQIQSNNSGSENILATNIEENLNLKSAESIKNYNPELIKRNIDTNNLDNKIKKQVQITAVAKDNLTDVTATSFANDESEDNNNYAFYNITEERFNKSKVGGFLRKMKRIVTRKISAFNYSKNQKEVADN